MSCYISELVCGDPPQVKHTESYVVVTGTDVGAVARYTLSRYTYLRL